VGEAGAIQEGAGSGMQILEGGGADVGIPEGMVDLE